MADWFDEIRNMFSDQPKKTQGYDPAVANARLEKLATAMGAKPEDVAPYKALMQFNHENYADLNTATEANGPSKMGTIIGAPMASIGTLLASGGRQVGVEQAQGMVDKFYGHRNSLTDLLKAEADNASKYGSAMAETAIKRQGDRA